MAFVECGGNSAPLFSNEPIDATAQAIHGLVSCAEWTGVMLSTLLEETGIDPKAKWLIAEGADSLALSRSVPIAKGARRRDDRALPERRAAHARQRLSDAAAPSRLGRQHERQVSAAAEARRGAGHELLRGADLRADPAERQGVSVLLPPGGQVLHHAPVSGIEDERAGPLRGLRRRLFGQRPDREGHGLRRRRQDLGAGGAAGAGAAQGVHAVPRALALGRRAGDSAKPRVGRGGQRAADARARSSRSAARQKRR